MVYLFPHFPQALHTMVQVAAPQQLAAKDRSCYDTIAVSK